MGYEEMAHDAGYRGDEARQVAAQLEHDDHMELQREHDDQQHEAWVQEQIAQQQRDEQSSSDK